MERLLDQELVFPGYLNDKQEHYCVGRRGQFRCDGNRFPSCLDWCNGRVDCFDGSDENNCDSGLPTWDENQPRVLPPSKEEMLRPLFDQVEEKLFKRPEF